MRAKCAMYGCKNATYNQLGYLLTFHRFPKNPERHLIWKELCKNPRIMNIPHNRLFLCSHHFDKSCFSYLLLKPNAIPNRNLAKEGVGLFSAMAKENNRMRDNGTDAGDKTAEPKVTGKREVAVKKVMESSEEIEQGDSSEGNDSDSSKLLEASGDESNDSSKASLSWYPNATRSTSEAPKVPEPVISSIMSLAPGTSKASSKEEIDDCSTFAEFVKTRMRKFDSVQKTIAQKLISDVLFMADTKQLEIGSIVMTPQAIPTTMAQGMRVRVPQDNSSKSEEISVYVSDDDSDDDSPLAKRKK